MTYLKEYDWAWKKIGGEPPKMRDQYSSSPLKKRDRTYYWRNIPKDAIRELYIVSFKGGTHLLSQIFRFITWILLLWDIPQVISKNSSMLVQILNGILNL